MRCPLLLLAASVVLGGMNHSSPELVHHEPSVASISVKGSDSMHSCSSVLCSIEGHAPTHHFANTHTCPGASSMGWTCAVESGLPEHGSTQPHTPFNPAGISPKFGGLHVISTPGRTFLIDHVRAAHSHGTEHTHPPHTYRAVAMSHRPRSLREASTPTALLPRTYHLPCMQVLTVTGEMEYIDVVLTLIICSVSLLCHNAAMCHNARSKRIPPR